MTDDGEPRRRPSHTEADVPLRGDVPPAGDSFRFRLCQPGKGNGATAAPIPQSRNCHGARAVRDGMAKPKTKGVTRMTNFHVLEVSIALVECLRQPLKGLRARDPCLYRQIRTAASSVGLNIAEGNRRQGLDRLHCFRVAAGSAAEVQTALRLAAAWGDLDARAAEPVSTAWTGSSPCSTGSLTEKTRSRAPARGVYCHRCRDPRDVSSVSPGGPDLDKVSS